MPLDVFRNETMELIRGKAEEAKIVASADRWFLDFKQWEVKETFDRAFADDRMTLRMAPFHGEVKTFEVNSAENKPREMKFNPHITALTSLTNPKTFLDKKKNELGLHEYSAVLLNHNNPISKQAFSKTGAYPIFMPIPLEEDMQLFEELSRVAKQNRDGALYQFVVNIRAKMTRITYGDPTDMKVGFLRIDKGDNKDHFKYGQGVITGAAVAKESLLARRANALNYKTKIINQPCGSANNEVTIKYRQHAGDFPWVGNPGPIDAQQGFPKVEKDQFAMATFKSEPRGILSDDGKFKPFKM